MIGRSPEAVTPPAFGCIRGAAAGLPPGSETILGASAARRGRRRDLFPLLCPSEVDRSFVASDLSRTTIGRPQRAGR
eukprot:5699147-Pyramimonas_sp.AAC.1